MALTNLMLQLRATRFRPFSIAWGRKEEEEEEEEVEEEEEEEEEVEEEVKLKMGLQNSFVET